MSNQLVFTIYIVDVDKQFVQKKKLAFLVRFQFVPIRFRASMTNIVFFTDARFVRYKFYPWDRAHTTFPFYLDFHPICPQFFYTF